jgi:hypothetical protein
MRWLLLAALLAAGCGGSDVSRTVGARCDAQSECDDRCLLPGDGWAGGFCTQTCDEDRHCSMGAVCVDVEGGVCLFPCAEEDDCAFLEEGWQCITAPGRPSGEVMVCGS